MRNAAEAEDGPAVVRHRRVALPVPDKAALVLGKTARALDRIVLGNLVTADHAAGAHRPARAQMGASVEGYNRAGPILKGVKPHENETQAIAQTRQIEESVKARGRGAAIKRGPLLGTNGVSAKATAVRTETIEVSKERSAQKHGKENAPIDLTHGNGREATVRIHALAPPAISQTIVIMIIGIMVIGMATTHIGPSPPP